MLNKARSDQHFSWVIRSEDRAGTTTMSMFRGCLWYVQMLSYSSVYVNVSWETQGPLLWNKKKKKKKKPHQQAHCLIPVWFTVTVHCLFVFQLTIWIVTPISPVSLKNSHNFESWERSLNNFVKCLQQIHQVIRAVFGISCKNWVI